MKIPRKFLFDILLIVTYIVLFSLPLNIFGGFFGYYSNFPKGDDAQTHAALTLFVSKNWPQINWYPYWYSGVPIFLSYHPLVYFFWGIFTEATTLPVTSTLFLFTALSYSLTAIALYVLVHKITSNRYSAFLSPILLTTSGGFISPLLAGGIYTRLFATMFWMFSLLSLFCLMKNPSEKKFFIITVLLLAATITSNLLIGLFSVLTAVLVIIYCSHTIKGGIALMLKIFIPVLMLSAFFYLPFFAFSFNRFFSFSVGGGHYSIPQPLIYLGAGATVPLLLLFIAALLRRHMRIEYDFLTKRFSRVLIALMVFLFFYGFTVLPPNIRFAATYDSTYFLSIYISIYCGIVFGGIFNEIAKGSTILETFEKRSKSRLLKIRSLGRHRLHLIILFLALILPLSYYPLLMQTVVDPGASSWDYPAFIADQIVKINPSEDNFRFSTDWIHVMRWFNYRYDLPQTEGVQSMAVLYPQWNRWFQEAVFTNPNNWIETNFLLDWYGVRWFLASRVVHSSGGGDFFKRYGLTEKFLNRPEYYSVRSSVEIPSESYWSGPAYFFEYEEATPVLSESSAITALVLAGNDQYDEVFRSLSPSGYDSRYVIPVRGSVYIDDYTSEDLMRFDVVVLSSFTYREADKARTLLKEYVEGGGGLIIETGNIDTYVLEGLNPVNQTKEIFSQDWNFTYVSTSVSNWVDFSYFAAPSEYWVASKDIQPWASTIVMNSGYPTVVFGSYSKGRVIYDGLRVSHHASLSDNQMESFFFSKLIELAAAAGEKAVQRQVVSSKSVEGWIIYLGGRETRGTLSTSGNITREGHSTLELGYGFNTSVAGGEYIEYRYAPRESWDWTDMKFLSLWVHGDNSTNQLKIAILSPDWSNSFQTTLILNWVGWRKIIVPLTAFGIAGKSKLTNVNEVSFVIEETRAYNQTWSRINLDDISIVQLKGIENNADLHFTNPNPELLKLTVNRGSGVLFKESFFQNWVAQLTDRNGVTRNLVIYRAGPDFMYVSVPDGTEFPAELVFEYRVGLIEKASYVASFFTLVALIIYGLSGRLHRLSDF